MLRHDLSPKKNLEMVIEAFYGTREARALHATHQNNPISIESGLNAVSLRWPRLQNTNTSEPIFIFSAGWRSGSTFLQRAILSSGETLIWGEPYSHAGLIESLASQVKAFTKDWPQDEFFVDRFSADELSQQWVANLYPEVQSLFDAHIAYFENLFAAPAVKLGKKRWGLKEVKLGTDHALYLRWLFPRAKFIFLYRNPYHAYCSYRKWRRWYKTWPDEPVFTPKEFGRLWKKLVDDFLASYEKVNGILLQYENLHIPDTSKRIQDYIDTTVTDLSALSRVGSADDSGTKWMPRIEYFLLKREVEPTSSSLGYAGL